MADITNKRINIYIDQQAAETALQKLQLQADGLTKKITAGQAAGKSMVAELKKLDGVNSSIKNVQQQLDNGLKPSLAQQTSLVSQLRNELKRLSESDTSFAAKLKNYKEQNTELQRMQSNVGLVSKETNGWGTAFERVATRIAEYTSVYFLLNKVSEFFKSSVEEANKAEQAYSRLENILGNIGRQDVFKRLKSSAEELSATYKTFKADEVIEVFQKLITYGKLTELQINQLTPVIIDFAAKQRISLSDATEVLTKSLEGNNKGLRDYGINIKSASTVSERFGIIMQDLKPRVEGAAKAFGETTAGQIKETEVAIDDIKEKIGGELQPVIKGFYDGILGIIQGIEQAFDRAKKNLTDFVASAKLVGGVLKDIATLSPGDAAARIAEFNAQKNAVIQKQKETEDLQRGQDFARTVTQDAATKSLKDQQKILSDNEAILKGSFKSVSDVLATNKQNTEEGKKILQQYLQDVEVVKQLKALIASEQDKKTLGVGGGDDNGENAKKLEEAEKKLEEARKKWEELLQSIKTGIAKQTIDPYIEQINEILQKREELKKQIVELGTAAHASQDEIKGALQDANKLALLQAQTAGKAAIAEVENTIRNSHLKAPTTQDPTKQQVDFLNDPDLELIGARLKAHQKVYDEDTKNAKDAEEKQLENLVGYANQVVDIYTTIANFKTNQENAAFNKEVKLNESRKKSLESLLNGKLISQNQYNKETQKLDAELEKKKEDLERKQFRRGQVQSIANTLIDGAEGEIKLWAELGAAAIPFQIALAAETLAKVGFIAAQKPSFGKGGALTGPSHSQGGMPVINPTTGQKEAEVEGGEYIISKNTVRNNKGLADALLFTSLYRNGAPVQRNYVPVDYAGITKTYNHLKFAVGGIMPAANPVVDKSSGEDLSIVLNAILQSLNTPTQPIVIQNAISLKQIDDAQAQRTRIIQNANFKG